MLEEFKNLFGEKEGDFGLLKSRKNYDDGKIYLEGDRFITSATEPRLGTKGEMRIWERVLETGNQFYLLIRGEDSTLKLALSQIEDLGQELLFIDNFDGTALQSYWNTEVKSGGTIVVENGYCKLNHIAYILHNTINEEISNKRLRIRFRCQLQADTGNGMLLGFNFGSPAAGQLSDFLGIFISSGRRMQGYYLEGDSDEYFSTETWTQTEAESTSLRNIDLIYWIEGDVKYFQVITGGVVRINWNSTETAQLPEGNVTIEAVGNAEDLWVDRITMERLVE